MSKHVAPIAEREPTLLFTVPTFATAISWHPESVRRAIRDGRLRAVKLGPDWRLPREELERVTREGM